MQVSDEVIDELQEIINENRKKQKEAAGDVPSNYVANSEIKCSECD